ncbi:Capsule assembly protein Wzi [Alkalitalea saponilacus]|uniref:Capsule assembly protein Wzi n=2 Tax=Alkalitalea saponilacus TaxID=889453 RepID=A0A1T5FR11_9BACT|nr:Capsule assembly protein Wzi [Alkalitalea saponilacus]
MAFIAFAGSTETIAAEPEFSGSVASSVIMSSGNSNPFWFHSREQGRWNHTKNDQLLSTATGLMNYSPHRNWNLKAEAEINYNTAFEELILHTGYLSASWRFMELTAGRHIFDPIFTESNSGHGAYLFGDNNRPITRVTAGIPQYTKLPFPFGRIEIRGGISHGWLDDDNDFRYHKEVVLHEKFAYIRWDANKIKPYAGINHSALMGGYYWRDGTYTDSKIPMDFMATFFASGSEKIGGGEETNAAGAHMGLYDFGLYWRSPVGRFHIYYQAPFADGSGMRVLQRNIDQVAGVNWHPRNSAFLKNLTVEWINTRHQSGNGMPDPLDPRPRDQRPEGRENVNIIVYADLADETFRNDLMEYLGYNQAGGYSQSEANYILRQELNNGNKFGGRDGYMSNGHYPAGWTYYDFIMGSPLNLTYNQVSHLNPNLGTYNRNNIINDRMQAIHVGAQGVISEQVSWKTMITLSRNYGSYFHQYPGRYTWAETENYYFKGGRNQLYSLIEMTWSPPVLNNLTFNGAIAIDRGEIFDATGMKIGAQWRF